MGKGDQFEHCMRLAAGELQHAARPHIKDSDVMRAVRRCTHVAERDVDWRRLHRAHCAPQQALGGEHEHSLTLRATHVAEGHLQGT